MHHSHRSSQPATSGRWLIRKRPNSLPRYWRNISRSGGADNYTRFRDSLLVLNACNIPHKTISLSGREHIYVPPLLENIALSELTEFSAESHKKAPTSTPLRVHPHSFLAALFLLPLLVWHGWRVGWWPTPLFLPPPDVWASAGMLDNVLVRVYDQYYRLATALTLHVSLTHVWGNAIFGALFLSLLARLAGIGRAFWLTVAGGIAGNALTVLLRPRAVTSMGFSTALFAAVGALAGFMAMYTGQRRKAVLPVAAGIAILAMLGTEGENTDYAAHIAGLCSGLALGAWEAWRTQKKWPALPQILAGSLAAALLAGAWYWAFMVLPA
ncbi:MAG: hypothetical protein DESF_02464 [Desulfovibrio sp.]